MQRVCGTGWHLFSVHRNNVPMSRRVVQSRACCQNEINELNCKLWRGRDVIGLYSPKVNRHENLERIIDILGVPLFDVAGNQTPKEFVVDRCLYNMNSGKLSMDLA